MIGGRKDNGNMSQKTVQVEVFFGEMRFFLRLAEVWR